MKIASLRAFALVAGILATTAVFSANLDDVADAVLGKPGLTSTGSGVSATNMGAPMTMAEDSVSGQLWVVDARNNRVLRFASASSFSNGEAADVVLGQVDFTHGVSNPGGVSASTLSSPWGIVVDGIGRVYVADGENNRILRFDPPFSNGMAASLVLGQSGFTSNNTPATPTSSSLSFPTGMAIDFYGDLIVSDWGNNRLLLFYPPLSNGMAATTVVGQANFNSKVAAAGSGGLSGPLSLSVDASWNLWVVDRGNNRVLKFNGGGWRGDFTAADLVLCQGSFATSTSGAGLANCNAASGVAVDASGTVYVADYGNNRVLRFVNPTINGVVASSVIGSGCALSAIGLCGPTSAMLDRMGDLLVADFGQGRLLRFDIPVQRPAPSIGTNLGPSLASRSVSSLELAVNGARFFADSYISVGGVAHPTTFVSPGRLLTSIDTTTYATDTTATITVTTPAPGGGNAAPARSLPLYAAVGGDGVADRVLGQPNFTMAYADWTDSGGGAFANINASFIRGPISAVVASSGRLFVADTFGNRVLSWPSADAFNNDEEADVVLGQRDVASRQCNQGSGSPTAATLCGPDGLAVDEAGGLYVGDGGNHRVLYFPDMVTGSSATRVYGQGGSYTAAIANNGGVSAASLSQPSGVAYRSGLLFVNDSGNDRILLYYPAWSASATLVLGQADFASHASWPASATHFHGAGHLALDSSLNLWAAFSAQNRVMRFPGVTTADIVLGQPDFTTTAAPAAGATSLNAPYGVAVDGLNRLWVGDAGNNRVVRYDGTLATGMAATAVLGQTTFTGSAAGTTSSAFKNPRGVAVYNQADLLVADTGNVRMLQFNYPLTGSGHLAVLKSGPGAGRVVSSPAGIDCGATCDATLALGITVKLTAYAASGSVFAGWSGACTGSGTCTVVLGSQTSVTAIFNPPSQTLSVVKSGAGSGTIRSSPSGIDCGATCSYAFPWGTAVTLTYEAATGSEFVGWSGACTGSGGCTVTIDGAVSVGAVFRLQPMTLTVAKTGTGQGSVTSSPAGIDCGATCSTTYDYGTSVTLTAIAANGSVFTGWAGGGCSSTGACTITMNSATTVTANFDSPTRSVGISTRMGVLTGDNVMIAGFIISGSGPKTVVVRARGPSLGVAGALANPTLTLVPADGSPVMSNDDWGTAANAAQLQAIGYQPAHPQESAIMATLNPGAYTAIVSGVGNTAGVAIAEVYEIDHPEIPMTGISTRGFVRTGDNVMIGGFIIQGSAPQTVVVRARGPSLDIAGALADPTLTLVPGDGSPPITNDDWGTAANAAQLQSMGYQPANPKESAILITLNPGAYTAIVSGVGGATGIAIVEVYTP